MPFSLVGVIQKPKQHYETTLQVQTRQQQTVAIHQPQHAHTVINKNQVT